MLKLTEIVHPAEPPSATLTLTFEQRQRSRLRVTLDDGRAAALMLARGTVLRGGDCVRAADGGIVRIAAAPEAVSTVRCADPRLLARASYHLGNRHIALQVGAGWLRYQQDHVLDNLVRELGLRPLHESGPFEPEAGAYGHAHGGGPGVEAVAGAQRGSPDEAALAEDEIGPDPHVSIGPVLLSLLRLTSASLPIGSFAYSQGMEYAVERGWIRDAASTRDWIAGLLSHTQRQQDMPLFARLYRAWEAGDCAGIDRWNARLLAARESRELRAEEINVGAALARLLADLGVARARRQDAQPSCSDRGNGTPAPYPLNPEEGAAGLQRGYLALFALACVEWHIPLYDAVCGCLWSWCQNQVAAAIKLVPLGQTAGQRILQDLIALIPGAAVDALAVEDDEIGFTAPGLALASARHEGQYTRLFLS